MNLHNDRTRDVVVIGAGLTGLTTAFYLKRSGFDVEIVERENRIGGQIHTYRSGKYIFESGPNTGVVSYPEVAELFENLKEHCEMQTARESAKCRLIWKGKRFYPLPHGMKSGLLTPLFTVYDKLRIVFEPFRAKGTDIDESVGALTVRRLGKSYLKYAVDPFISGIYAGDPMRLTTRFALPKLYNLEQNYGSFIRGAIAKAKEPKTDRDRLATKKVFSVCGGLENLTYALGKSIGSDNISTGAKATVISPDNEKWQVRYTDIEGTQHTINCSKVITTCGAYSLPELLPFIDNNLIEAISCLHYAPIVQVGVCIGNTRGMKHDAFGALVPSCEHQNVLGILFPSSCFDGRAPHEGAVFSFFMGGIRHPEYIEKSDEELKSIVDDALHRMLKMPKDCPIDDIKIFRHAHAIPQYESNSAQRYAAIEEIENRYKGLILAGNIKGGIGMADRIRQGTEIAASFGHS